MENQSTLEKPVHLYVKTHNVTGLKYFGRTIKDPFKYKDSGLYWRRHIEKYGNDVTTEVVGTFIHEDELHSFAEKFSRDNDIVDSPLWANLITETGYAGIQGWSPDLERRSKMSENSKAMWSDPEFKAKMAISQSKSWTAERKKNFTENLHKRWADPAARKARSEWAKTQVEQNRKFSQSRKGATNSAETRKLISNKLRGRARNVPDSIVWDEEEELYILKNGLRVKRSFEEKSYGWVCLDNGMKFRSFKDAYGKLDR